MLDERNVKIDLFALGLLAVTILVAASLLTHDPADSPGSVIFPQPEGVSNVCGRIGATVAWLLLTGLGLGAYHALASLGVLTAILLTRRPIKEPLPRTIGWLVSLAGISTVAAMALPTWSPGPVIGSGGYLGAAGQGLLELYFASLGAYIVVASLIVGGLLLCTDYVLVRLLAWIIGKPAVGLGRGVGRLRQASRRRTATARNNDVDGELDDVLDEDHDDWEEYDEDEEDDEEDEELTVRISGRAAARTASGKSTATGKNGQPADDEDADSAGETKNVPKPLRVQKPRKTDREKVFEQIEAAVNTEDTVDYDLPSLDLLLEAEPFCFEEHEQDVRRKARILEKTFTEFGFNIRVVEIQTGPVIAQFEVELEAGLRLSKITGLADDLAIALRVPSVRIVAPIPGKNTVGIEVPNADRQLVRLRDVMEQTAGAYQDMRVPLFLGKNVSGNAMVVDLARMPHLLIAGRTGTGKSVCLNSMIVSMLMTRRPDEVRLLLIDPKMVELSPYKRIPHLMHPVVTDMRKAEAILAWAVDKMEERYQLLARAGVRHLDSYNQLDEEEIMERVEPVDDDERAQIPLQMPYIVIVADEMADLMMTSAKEVETHIIRLAQKSRAVGIHLVLATQKPTVDVITGLIKSNLPARLCFEVSSRTDSRVVLDEMGADRLLGHGDMLFLKPGISTLIRGQGTFLSDEEIVHVIESVATVEPQFVKELVQLKTESTADGEAVPQWSQRDDLYEAAIDLVIREGRGSLSLLQRGLGIGYGRAARLVDYMAEDGIVGPYNGSQAREVLLTVEDWTTMQAGGRPVETSSPNKILLGKRPEVQDVPVDPAPPQEGIDPTALQDSDEDYMDEEAWDDDDASWQAETA